MTDPTPIARGNGAKLPSMANAAVEIPLDTATEVARLAKLPPIAYDRERDNSAKTLGVRVAALDKEVVAARRACEDEATSARCLDLVDPEPWPEPVDGAGLLLDIASVITRYCALPDGAATAVALWCLHSYSLPDLFASPILCLSSPEKRCGKTTLLTVIGALVYRPLTASNITPAALFRSVERWGPTLLIDEADTFIRQNSELRGIINSGHTRSSAFVIRNVEIDGEHQPVRFSTWCAKAIALIGTLPDTLADRAIIIPMRRRMAGESVERLRLDRLNQMEDIPRRCQRWAQDHGATVKQIDPVLPHMLNDRAADNWRPLFAIAETVGGHWPELAQTAVLKLVGADNDAPSIGVQLLTDIKDAFDDRKCDCLSTTQLLDVLTADNEAPWATWNKGKPMSARQLATRLREFRIASKTVRIGRHTPKGYACSQFDDAFRRYIPTNLPAPPDQSATPPHPSNGKGSSDSETATQAEMLRIEKPMIPSNGKGCGGVADTAGGDSETTSEYF